MHDDVVKQERRQHDGAPVQVNPAPSVATPPSGLVIIYRHCRGLHVQAIHKVLHTLIQDYLGLLFEPFLDFPQNELAGKFCRNQKYAVLSRDVSHFLADDRHDLLPQKQERIVRDNILVDIRILPNLMLASQNPVTLGFDKVKNLALRQPLGSLHNQVPVQIDEKCQGLAATAINVAWV